MRGLLVTVLVAHASVASAQPRQSTAVIQVLADERLSPDPVLVDRIADAVPSARVVHSTRLNELVMQRLSRPSSNTTESVMQGLRNLIEQGLNDFWENRFDSSIQKLTDASTALRNVIDRVGQSELTTRRLFESQIILAVALKHGGDMDRAVEVLRQTIRTFPQIQPTTADFSPDIVGLYRNLRAEMDASEMGQVRIETAPSHCGVLRDGQYVGVSTLAVPAYLGNHTFQVRCNGRLSRLRKIVVTLEPVTIRVDARADLALRSNENAAWLVDGPGALPASVEIGRAVGVDRVILVRSSPTALRLEEVDVRGGRAVARSEGTNERAEAAVAALSAPVATSSGRQAHSIDALDGVLLTAAGAGILGGTAMVLGSVLPGRRCASATIDSDGDCAYIEVPGSLWPAAGVIAAGAVAGLVVIIRLIAGDAAEAQ